MPGHPGDLRPHRGPGRLQRALHRPAGVGAADVWLGVSRLWVGQRGLRGRRRDGHAGSGPGAGPRDGSGLAAVPRTSLPEPSPGPSADSARATAAPVFAAVGLDASAARVEPGAPTTWVSVDPVVDGLPTSGWATSVTVDAEGIGYADGHLATPERSDPYPLISAADAYGQLADQPQPAIGACPSPTPRWGPRSTRR